MDIGIRNTAGCDGDSVLTGSRGKGLEVHFFTIVLNGEPFIRYHLDVFNSLPFTWHWHIIEGVADLVKDTAWSKPLGGRICSEFHKNGRSRDGTGLYLDKIKAQYPDRITVYRQPEGRFWSGKLEMVNAPLANLKRPCLMWQVDVDEFWVAGDLYKVYRLFEQNPEKTAAYFHCHYFVGPLKYVVSMNTWATGPRDWLRVWRYRPGMAWASHEPPVLQDRQKNDVARINPFSRDFTLEQGIAFQHYAYVLESQVRFKESYYGYRGAVEKWRRLNRSRGRVKPSEFLPWAGGDAWVDDWQPEKGRLLLAELLADRVPNSYRSMMVKRGTAFEAAIFRLVEQARPKKIIETGTYLGRGTTTILWQALKKAGIEADFTTIEVNPDYYRQAKEYFISRAMDIKAVCGLSIAREMLPTKEQIQQDFVNDRQPDDIYYDHSDKERSARYFAETDFAVADRQLEKALARFGFKPDMVLLDSAGHLGFIEFELLRSRLKGSCHIVLDDVHHCKHHRSLEAIKADPRFRLLEEKDEKFGFAIARFEPVQCLVFLRTDSIGDNILAATIVEPLYRFFGRPRVVVVCQQASAELYRQKEFVARVIEIPNEHRWANKLHYGRFIELLKAEKPDMLVNTTYSCHQISDLPGLDFIPRRIAFRNCRNATYTRILDPGPPQLPELKRHARFLEQMGIEDAEQLVPCLEPGTDDMTGARNLLARHCFEPEKTLALCPSSRVAIKNYAGWKPVLEYLCRRGFKVIALGVEGDRDFAADMLEGLGTAAVNLCGRTSLLQAAALLKMARLAMGCDSGLAHLACAVGTPNVVVVGGGHFGRFFPYSRFTAVVCNPLNCFGCNWNCRYGKAYCIADIDPWLVQKAVTDRLEEKRFKRPRIYFQELDGQEKKSVHNYPRPVDCAAFLSSCQGYDLYPVKPVQKTDTDEKNAPTLKAGLKPADSDLPVITVVTPCLNQAEFLEQCMTSVLDQGYPRLEYVVIDGGSRDGSVEIIRKYASRLAFWRSSPDDGQYAAIGEGFKKSGGQIMTWLNADDILYPGTLYAVAAIFRQRPEIRWITGRPNSLSPDGSKVHISAQLALWSRKRYLEKRYFTPFIQQEGTFWTRDLWLQAGGRMAAELKMAGDLELWTRFFRHARLYSVDATLAIFRQHKGQKTDKKMKLYFFEAEKVIDRELANFKPEAGAIPPAPAPITFEQVQRYLAAEGFNRPWSWRPVKKNACRVAAKKPPASARVNSISVGSSPGEKPGRIAEQNNPILVTALVSTYNSEKFIQGCLEDLLSQSLGRRLEIIVVDSGSMQDEGRIVKGFQQRYANIRYLRTGRRESVYQAWNRAIELARGKYLTTANTDDRHRKDALEKMAAVMEKDQSIALVYADVIVTDRPCSGFADCRPTGFLRWHDWSRDLLLEKGCFMGPQPMWRRRVHEFFGDFDTRYKVAADYEFWLRISQVFQFYHLPEALGIYLERADSVEHANRKLKIEEEKIIVSEYRLAAEKRKLIGCRPLEKLACQTVQDGSAVKDLAQLRSLAVLCGLDLVQLDVLDAIAEGNRANRQQWLAALRRLEINFLKGGKQMYSENELMAGIDAMNKAGCGAAARWALEKLVADFPQSASARYNLGVLAFDDNLTDQARENFEAAADLAPGNADIQKQLGDFYYVACHDAAKALERYENVIRLRPDDVEALTMAAHLNVALQNFDQALEHYYRVMEKDAGNSEIRQIVDKLEARKKGETAAGSAQNDQNAEQLYGQVRKEIESGNRSRSKQLLKQMVERFPDFAPAYNDLGVMAYEDGRPDEARKYYQKAVSLAPDDGTFHKNLADFYLVQDKKIKDAMEHYLKAMTIDPTDVEALMATGRICRLMEKYEDAQVFFERVLEIEPWNDDARRLLDAGQSGSCRSEMQPGGPIDPLKPEGFPEPESDPFQPGPESADKADLFPGDLETRIAELEQRLGQAPGDALAHNDLGVLCYEAGRKQQALEHYLQAVQLAPEQATFKKNLADFYFIEHNQLEKAMEIYVDLLKKDPRDVESLTALGQMCRMMGKYDDARQFLSRALEIAPGNQELLKAVNLLEDQVAEIAKSKRGGSSRGELRMAAS